MDNNKMLYDLLGALKALNESEIKESPIVYSIDNIWSVIKEICGIKISGPFNFKILDYVLERVGLVKFATEDCYDDLIEFLTTTKIEMNGELL
ncbi:hypothetical protein [Paenibacillus sp. FSL P4-0502]|uniref:hypothetical protein n=1 Tax=Paenibacillus sp. FSL P4-0502 TaxID=2975319 RepID=UPI0030F677BF